MPLCSFLFSSFPITWEWERRRWIENDKGGVTAGQDFLASVERNEEILHLKENWKITIAQGWHKSFVFNKHLLLCLSWLLWPPKISFFTEVSEQETLPWKKCILAEQRHFCWGSGVISKDWRSGYALFNVNYVRCKGNFSFFSYHIKKPVIINLDKLGLIDNNEKRLLN